MCTSMQSLCVYIYIFLSMNLRFSNSYNAYMDIRGIDVVIIVNHQFYSGMVIYVDAFVREIKQIN